MPLKDLEKLTVVKLRAELTSRGLDAKGNKPFLIERLRAALELEEQQNPPSGSKSSDLDENTEAQLDEELVEEEKPADGADCLTITDPQQKMELEPNGAMEGAINSKLHPNLEDKVAESSHIEVPEKNTSSAPINNEETGKDESPVDDVNNSSFAVEAPDDSTMAVYGGKDDTFMDISTSEQLEEPATVCGQKELQEQKDSNNLTSEMPDQHECELENQAALHDVLESETIPEMQDEIISEKRQIKEPSADGELEKDIDNDKNVSAETDLGDKRNKRSRSPSPDIETKAENEGPLPEDEPEWEANSVVLDWYNSDLNLVIDKDGFCTASPLTEGGFAYMWAGARATFGFSTGKVYYEVKIIEHLAVTHLEENEPNPHLVRVGWSIDSSSLQLGEDVGSFGYGGSGKISNKSEFKDYGKTFQQNDVVGVYLDANPERDVIEISYTVNGQSQGIAFTIQKDDVQGQPLFPHVLTKNCKIGVNFGQNEVAWFPPDEGYEFAGKINVESRVRGTLPPSSRADCEMIMLCGLPSAGKTTWANQFCQENNQRKFNILGTNAFLDKMKVNGLPRRKNYHGRWEVLIEKCTRCLNTILEIAAKRRRNYILDQTNVYPTAQKRKMSCFSGFRRRAVVIVPSDDEYKTRVEKHIKEEGKDIPDSAIMEMKANFKLPVVDETFSQVDYVELGSEEAAKLVEKYNTEAKNAGYGQPPSKRPRHNYGNRGHKNERDSRRHPPGRDRRRNSRGSNSHRSSRAYRDNRDSRHRPPPPTNWRGNGRGWNNRGPPPLPLPPRNGPYNPRRGPPPPSGRGNWSAPLNDRPFGGGRSGGGGGGRNYNDRRNERSSYSTAPRRDGPSPWINPPMTSSVPPRNPWPQPWSNTSTPYGQQSYGNSTPYGGSNYGPSNINPWSQSGYQYPYNPNPSSYSGSK